MNMITRAFAKFIKKERVFCQDSPCCLAYGTHLFTAPSGNYILLCDKHSQPTKKEQTQCQRQP